MHRCEHCHTPIIKGSIINYEAEMVDGLHLMHTATRCRDKISAELRALQAGGDTNIYLDLVCGASSLDGVLVRAEGGCGQVFDKELTYRCTDCNTVFHRDCARRHFHAHEDEKQREVEALCTSLMEIGKRWRGDAADAALRAVEDSLRRQAGVKKAG